VSERRLLVADLHNHSLLSDGEGDPRTAFAQMRAAGLDVAALTDHASIPRHVAGGLRREDYPSAAGFPLVRTAPSSLDEAEWQAAGRLADTHDEPGAFTAMRGFEWTEPWLGHVNVWFSEAFLPVTTPGTVVGLHDWLVADEPSALFGYNHPGREDGRFEDFRPHPRLRERMVSLEVFNRYDDYVAVGVRHGRASPLLECLRAGWRPGLSGVSDEHGRDYGLHGKGRTGVWAPEHSRDGVRAAMLERRTFATREVGLSLHATLDAAPMGARARPGMLEVELDATADWADSDVRAQVLVDAGGPLPEVVLEASLDPFGRTGLDAGVLERYPWAVLRIVAAGTRDPSVGLADHPLAQRALAYASPWWLAD
jgi:hypothetical protein